MPFVTKNGSFYLKRSRGTGPRATGAGTARFIVGRGPVPRHAPIAREIRSAPETIAGDRPPRYGSLSGPFYRRARACPSPCTDRGRNPLRSPKRSRGTGPRATVASTASLIVGRGTGPRHAPIAEEIRSAPETLAGDRLPHYRQEKKREGQASALRRK